MPLEARRKELKKRGHHCSLVNARFVKPVDTDMLDRLAEGHKLIVTIEENVLTGGFGQQVLDYVSRAELPVRVLNVGIPDDYVEHGNVEVLRAEVGLEKNKIVEQILADDPIISQ